MKLLLVLLYLAVLCCLGCGSDIFDNCTFEVGDLIDFTPSEDRALVKFLSTHNKCGEKISIELIAFTSMKKYRKIEIRIVEVKSKYSYIGIVN